MNPLSRDSDLNMEDHFRINKGTKKSMFATVFDIIKITIIYCTLINHVHKISEKNILLF